VEKRYRLDVAGQKIDEFLDNLLDLADLDLDFTISEDETLYEDFENPDLVVRFSGPDVEMLLENKAELLLALEHLTMEMLRMPSEDHSRVCFDANDYRVMRIEELRLSAMTAAERVKKTGIPFQFSPMNSRERRIIHLALRNESTIRSESVGMGPFRQVCIVPADMKTPPPARPMRPGPPRGDRGPRPGGGGRDRRGGPGGNGNRGNRFGRDRRGPRRDRH
jgi:spoIIIJ-associated protein